MERLDGICCDTCRNFPAVCHTKGKVIEVINGKKRERQRVMCASCAYKMIFADPNRRKKNASPEGTS